jgi:protein TonB
VFEDSLFATNQRRSPLRGVAAMLSFGLQAVFLITLVLIPLFYTDALPLTTLKNYVLDIPVPPGPRPQPPPEAHVQRPQNSSNMQGTILLPPNRIPDHIAEIHESAPPPVGPYVANSSGSSAPPSPFMSTLLASNMRPFAPPAVITHPKSVVLSKGVTEGLLIQKITPVYPKLAIVARQQGTVLLHAVIGRDGTIKNLQVISGPPMLVQAALDAVERWRYRPYLLNNEPVEVETQITVNFTLGG